MCVNIASRLAVTPVVVWGQVEHGGVINPVTRMRTWSSYRMCPGN
jgi:hypothetical protein